MVPFGWLIATQTPHVWQVVLISFVAGCLHVLDTPSRQALTLDLVPRAVASNAVSLNVLARSIGVGGGALLAGLLIGSTSVAYAYPVIGAAYGLAALLALSIRPRAHGTSSAERPDFTEAFRDAARLIVTNRNVRTLTLASVACEIFGFSYASAVPVIARDVLLAGPAQLGILNAAAALPGIFALMVLSLVQRRGRLEPILGAVFFTYGVGLLALSAARELLFAALAIIVIGACAATFDALQQTLVQFAVPEHQRGRAVGVWMFGIGSAPLGHLEMGTLTATFGAPTALMINGSVVLFAAATLLVRAPAYRLHRRQLA
jgi:predicted MFS family arabinose efflux permease